MLVHLAPRSLVERRAVAWADHGRDLINFLISYIDSPSLSSSPSTLYPTLDPVSSLDPALFHLDAPPHTAGPLAPALRLWRNKLIVGIGHSVGGAGTAYAATAIPSLFSSVLFCDPVMPPTHHVLTTAGLTGGALVRKDFWSSRKEASEGFLKKAFFRNWDPRVLKTYVQHGLKETAQGVQLKTRAKDEAVRTLILTSLVQTSDSPAHPARLWRQIGRAHV